MSQHILLENVRTHNLKGITCRIPRGKLTVITGVSGSGKSSLAIDSLYAEGQRRYTESLSTYARQFLERLPRPDLDRVDSIPPAIAIEQVNRVRNARSTVGTATEILDFLRLVLATLGSTVCRDCGETAVADTAESAAQRLKANKRVVITAPVRRGKVSPQLWAEELARAGYGRLWHKGAVRDACEWAAQGGMPAKTEVVVDRVVTDKAREGRLVAALREAFGLGAGVARAHVLVDKKEAAAQQAAEPFEFHEQLACPSCGHGFSAPTSSSLSFNSPSGACAACHGFGRTPGFDPDRVVPDPSLSLEDGAVAPFELPSRRRWRTAMLSQAREEAIPIDQAWSSLAAEHRTWVWEGSGRYRGVNGFFRRLERKRYRMHVRVLLARYRSFFLCVDCDGARLNAAARQVRLGGKNLAQLCELSVPRLRAFLTELFLSPDQRARAGHVLEEVERRLRTLEGVGLGYLTLARQTKTLSGGECQRINLAASLGSALTDTLFVLDEPTVGLHPCDVDRLLAVLRELVDLGNTVVVIEHDREVMKFADHIIELGPAAGRHGGELIFEGEPLRLAGSDTPTGRALRATPSMASRKRRPRAGSIVVRGATENNLCLREVRFPLQRLVCVTGLSGSGKTTLVRQVLYAGFRKMQGMPLEDGAGACRSIEGTESIEDMVLVDQAPPGRSSRSNPVTYIKGFDAIRKLLAETPTARAAKMAASHFSFNVKGGRCESCSGAGTVTVEMHFLADLLVTCDHCDGARFAPEALAVRYRGRNVRDILEMSADEAIEFFADYPVVGRRLDPLRAVGLGYIRLGQPTITLSGGEAQRLKLAGHLVARSGGGRRLFLLDEPTTGLHPADVEVLLEVFERLLDEGHSLVVIEHNPDLIARADHIIDLGPGGGEAGGQLVVAGSPEKVMECRESSTGQALRLRLEKEKSTPGRMASAAEGST